MAISTFNILSLCSGIGGLDLGIKRALPTARTVCYVERETFCVAVLAEKMRLGLLDDAPVWSNITTFDGKPWRQIVDCIIAGFPCQPWSVAGKRRGTADERWLWDDIWRIVCEVRPSYIFLENVPGLVRGGIELVLGSLAEMGFDAEWGCFTAAEIGAPHKRERLFILGCKPATSGSGRSLGNANGRYGTKTRASEQAFSPSGRPPGANQELADAASERCDEAWEYIEGLAQRSPISCQTLGSTSKFCLPRFPPRPGELDQWRGILENDPSLEPSLCRVAGGLPDWVDRIAALGNAVVPDQAALAFKQLFYRIIE